MSSCNERKHRKSRSNRWNRSLLFRGFPFDWSVVSFCVVAFATGRTCSFRPQRSLLTFHGAAAAAIQKGVSD